MNFTFLHCADLHLGSPMTGLALKDQKIAEQFAAASRDAFSDLVTRAIDERVAFVVIAGDLYDGTHRDHSIALFFNRQAARLARENIPIYLVKGNHDAENIVTVTIPLPATVNEFSTRKAQTHEIESLRVAIHGRSFTERAVTENWAVDYPAPRAGWFNIGMLHTSCEGNTQHATYAPCSVNDLVARGYDYWALGHVHQYQVLHRDPPIIYPGNIQGRNIREIGDKGAVLVDVADGRVVGTRRLIVDRARWVEVVVDISGAQTPGEIDDALKTHLLEQLENIVGKLVALRVRLVGETSLNGDLRARRADWEADILSHATHVIDDVWLEKLSVETSEPHTELKRPDLGALDLPSMLAASAGEPEFRQNALAALAQISAKTPDDVGGESVPLTQELDALIAEATAIVLARARGGESAR